MRSRRLLIGVGAVLLMVAVAIGWNALSSAEVRPEPVPAPIRISEPATVGTAPAAPTSDVPPVPSDVVPPPPLPGDDDLDDSDDDSDDD